MRRVAFVFMISIFFSNFHLSAQNEPDYFDKLFYTCKTWGFVKYFHSEVANCSANWDSVLLAKIPAIRNSPSNDAFNDILLDMVLIPGETALPEEPLPDVPDSLKFNLKTDWFDDNLISPEVRTVLDTIYARFRPGPHCLVQEEYGNPDFYFDNQYMLLLNNPSEEKRFLSLFRYWNIINYFYPHTNILDTDWDEVLKQMIPVFFNADDKDKYSMAALVLTKQIKDNIYTWGCNIHKYVGSSFPHFGVVTIDDQIVVSKVDPTISSVHPGDIIKSIDGFDINYLHDSIESYADGANQEAVEYVVNDLILGGKKGLFKITVENQSGLHNALLIRDWSAENHDVFLKRKV